MRREVVKEGVHVVHVAKREEGDNLEKPVSDGGVRLDKLGRYVLQKGLQLTFTLLLSHTLCVCVCVCVCVCTQQTDLKKTSRKYF